jgi:hypothetical protein
LARRLSVPKISTITPEVFFPSRIARGTMYSATFTGQEEGRRHLHAVPGDGCRHSGDGAWALSSGVRPAFFAGAFGKASSDCSVLLAAARGLATGSVLPFLA